MQQLYRKKEIMNVTKKDIMTNSIWIWSARNRGPFVAKVLMNFGANIKGFIDNSAEIQGIEVYGKRVLNPNDAYRLIEQKDIVLCCCGPQNNMSIRKQLKEHGIEKNVFDWDYEHILSGGMISSNAPFMEDGYECRLVSKCCNQEDFEQPYFHKIARLLGFKCPKRYHRKLWEYVYITQVLEESGMLQEGKKGLGFAVGEEPLPSLFAAKGVDILATDLGLDGNTARMWAESSQNALGDIEKIFKPNIITKTLFDKKVRYMDLDMNRIPPNIGMFDFCWSSCAIEHVGGLELSKQFLKNMINVLKPGGIAVHTTEFNIWSNNDTEEKGYSVIYRRRDFEEIQEYMKKNGCEMILSFKRTQHDADKYIPFPPYPDDDIRNHLNLLVGNYASTSFGLIIKKNI